MLKKSIFTISLLMTNALFYAPAESPLSPEKTKSPVSPNREIRALRKLYEQKKSDIVDISSRIEELEKNAVGMPKEFRASIRLTFSNIGIPGLSQNNAELDPMGTIFHLATELEIAEVENGERNIANLSFARSMLKNWPAQLETTEKAFSDLNAAINASKKGSQTTVCAI